MNLERSRVISEIRTKVVEIAGELGREVEEVSDDDLLPATGLLDSLGLLQLIVWYQNHFAIRLRQDEMTIDNLGTLNLMADFVLSRRVA